MRKIWTTILFVLSLVFVIVIFPIKADDVNEDTGSDAYMIVTNPGENASVEMRVSWHMETNKTSGKIVYTTKADSNWENSITLYPKSYISDAFHDFSIRHYNATLENLEPNTEYMYRVGQDNLSEIYYFKTAGSPSFSFVWAGDWHAYMKLPLRVEAAMGIIEKAEEVERKIDFFLSTGDVVAYGSDYDAWEHLFNQDPYKKYMWVNAIGNHDAMNNVGGANNDEYFATTHNYPKNGYEGQEGKSYYFMYNNSLFIVLNTEDINVKTPIAKVQQWAAEVIKNNPSQYIFVAMHYHWFNGVNGNNYQYNNWKKFFDEHNVDLVMSGHNHIYVRSERLYNDLPSADYGTVYMQVSSSDNDRGATMNENLSANSDKIVKRWTEDGKTVGAIIVNVDGKTIKTRLIDREGNIIDEVTIPSQTTIAPLNKNIFKESFSLRPSSIKDNAVVITSSVEGVGKIQKIEYYHEDNLLGVNYYVKRSDLSFTIDDALNYKQITAKIYYKDRTTEEVNLDVINQDFYKLNELEVVIDNYEFYLKWKYLGETRLKAWVFVNGIAYKQINLEDELVLLEDISITDNIEIRVSEDSVFGSYYRKYNIKGDVNLDGVIDNDDLYLIQQYILGLNKIDKSVLGHLDIDLDGEVTLYDLTYISLYINKYLQSISYNEYTITYLDYFGETIFVETVISGGTGTFPLVELPKGYVLSGWDSDVTMVSQDLVVKAIIEASGE